MNLKQLIETPPSSPFNLANHDAYRQWRDWKLANAPSSIDDLLVEVEDANALSREEIAAITWRCQACNMAIYIIKRNPAADKATIKNLGAQLGLLKLDSNICADEDSITSLTYRPDGRQKGYIPYSNMRLSWHTDGYYNTADKQIRAIVMFCVQPAAQGGENALLDHELLYIHLRDRDPAYISALMQANAMTIPPNIEAGEEIRGAQSGPVFSVHPQHGTLHMRYSARSRNIIWNDDAMTQEAVTCMSEYLNSADSPVLHYTLNAGEGIICNNVLHNRTGFTDDAQQKRLLYRARYYDRIADTELDQINLQIQE